MESVCGIEQGGGGDHAVDARNGRAVRSAQSVSGRGEHSRWSRISCLAQAKVQRGSAIDYGSLLRRRIPNLFAGTGVFLPRCSGVRQTGRATVSRAKGIEGPARVGATGEEVEMTGGESL